MESVALSRRVEKVSRFLAVSAGAVALLAALPPAAGADPDPRRRGTSLRHLHSYGPSTCHQMETSDLLVGTAPDAVLPLGDIQYDSATLSNLNGILQQHLGAYQVDHEPVLGNHETSGTGYFDYFYGSGVSGRPVRARGARAGTASTSAPGT